jgi:hypothetical protein
MVPTLPRIVNGRRTKNNAIINEFMPRPNQIAIYFIELPPGEESYMKDAVEDAAATMNGRLLDAEVHNVPLTHDTVTTHPKYNA